MDVWSRRILGTEVHECESGQLARDFFERVCRDEEFNNESLPILHSDNGAPMRSFTLASSTHSGAVMQPRSIPHLISDHRATKDTTIVDN
jgi:hypothetical protein